MRKSLRLLMQTICLMVLSVQATAMVRTIDQGLEVCTLYGTCVVTEPSLIALIQSPAFERLKKIHQYGVSPYVRQEYPYNRHEHSLGVFFITRFFGAPLSEQIAALLHDVSHTVFSHVGDYLFHHSQQSRTSYQDDIHSWYLEESGIQALLDQYGYSTVCNLEEKYQQRCFDQDLPDLCADRIEYNLMGGFMDGLLTKQAVNDILSHLHFEQGTWYFDDQAAAHRFASVSVELSTSRWGAPWLIVLNVCASSALRRAVELQLLNKQDIHFSFDDAVWQSITSATDATIARWVARMHSHDASYVLSTEAEGGSFVRGKFSGTDPLVSTQGSLQRLSALDEQYRELYTRSKEMIVQGYWIRFIDEPGTVQ